MKKSAKNLKQQSPQQPQQNSSPSRPQHHNLLQYYKSKIDSLCEQRLQWLAKFDQCRSKLTQKHSLKQNLLQTKNQHRQLNRNIVHHEIALMDQRLNVIRMERENLVTDYRDAEEVIRIGELMEMYPKEIQKMLPCHAINSGELIKNDLNIHNSRQKKSTASRSTKKQPPNTFNIKHSLSQKSNQRNHHSQYNILPGKNNKSAQSQAKISQEELFSRQLIELNQNQESQLETMQQLKSKLEALIKKTKDQQKQTLNKERAIVDQLNKEYKQLDKKHKSLADEYFTGRRQQKQSQEDLNLEREQLISKNKVLQEKVNKQMKTYEKENKAKQTLILKKSQDFQQNYKAKMRAKERNLQALKQNYEKMQNICIEKVTKLQNALNKAKHKLNEAEQRRDFLVDELRQQLHTLQRRVQEQKLQRQQRELKLRLKIQKQKLKNQEEKQKKQREQAKFERNRLIEESYKRTIKTKQNKSKSKSHQKPKKSSVSKGHAGRANVGKKDIYGKPGEESEEDDSLQMDDLDNIRRQIGQLETKIAGDTR